MNRYPTSWAYRVVMALALLLLIALGARAAAELLAPLVPALVALLILCGLFWVVVGRRK